MGLLNPGGPIAQFKRNRCSISPVELILQSGVRNGQIHIAKWVRNALDLNDGDELLFEVVDNKIIFTKAEG